MGVDIKSLKNRIKSVDSTLHLTKAMGLVASAKIRGASISMAKSRDYSKALDDTVSSLASSKSCERSEYMKSGEKGKRNRRDVQKRAQNRPRQRRLV